VAAALIVAAIDVTGVAAVLALLVPSLLLVGAIVYAHRSAPALRRSEAPAPRTEKLGVMTPLDEVPTEPSEPAAAPAPPEVPWPERVRSAEAAGDPLVLAETYLGWARDGIARGEGATAGDHLRETVRLAAKAKAAALHGEARLELAELARAAGDLTTACEHWQLARALFHDLKQRERVGETERLMQRHGCPTDWVLNDF
jgi:hypothetical protein